jgi:hypothetical protein
MMKALKWGLGVFLGASFLLCFGLSWPLQVFFLLGLGWALFLQEVLPQVDLHWHAVGETAVVAVALAVGLHLFLRWLWRQWHAQAPDARPWPVRWSVSVLALLVLLFGATMATVGLAHHVGWLASSPAPLVRSSWHFMPARMEGRAEQLCQRARLLSRENVPEEQLLPALLREPMTRMQLEQLAVVSWKGKAEEVGFLVFQRDPITRAQVRAVRCGGGLEEVESVPAEVLPRLLEEFQSAGSRP